MAVTNFVDTFDRGTAALVDNGWARAFNASGALQMSNGQLSGPAFSNASGRIAGASINGLYTLHVRTPTVGNLAFYVGNAAVATALPVVRWLIDSSGNLSLRRFWIDQAGSYNDSGGVILTGITPGADHVLEILVLGHHLGSENIFDARVDGGAWVRFGSTAWEAPNESGRYATLYIDSSGDALIYQYEQAEVVAAPPIADTFNRANQGGLGVTSDGKIRWDVFGGWTINANRAQAQLASGGGIQGYSTALLNTTGTKTDISTTRVAGTMGGLIWRFVDSNNFWFIDGTSLGYYSGGVRTVVATIAFGLLLRVRHVGNLLQVFVNDVSQFSGTVAAVGASGRSYGLWGPSQATWEDFNAASVQDLALGCEPVESSVRYYWNGTKQQPGVDWTLVSVDGGYQIRPTAALLARLVPGDLLEAYYVCKPGGP